MSNQAQIDFLDFYEEWQEAVLGGRKHTRYGF